MVPERKSKYIPLDNLVPGKKPFSRTPFVKPGTAPFPVVPKDASMTRAPLLEMRTEITSSVATRMELNISPPIYDSVESAIKGIAGIRASQRRELNGALVLAVREYVASEAVGDLPYKDSQILVCLRKEGFADATIRDVAAARNALGIKPYLLRKH